MSGDIAAQLAAMDFSDTKRLERIDEVRRLHLDQYVNLPQLIVVGDQSSGKSSVLEALTYGLPFPRDSGLCTRFPTQIVFKRSPVAKIEVSILATSESSSASKFGKKVLPALDNERFLKIISEACECMGLPKPNEHSEESKSFSLDMLKIELSGPKYEHFSVIDLPGLFRKATPGQTTVEDIALVRGMITKYMKNPRSIILAVVPANVDIATQEIIQLAEQFDPKRKRTLGVLTKPDLVDDGAEDKVLQLLRSDSFSLGYAIVCNRSQKNLGMTTTERNANELEFFSKEPWSQAPRDRVGIGALKKLFDKVLKDITRKSFDSVVRDIETKLKSNLQELEQTGPSRSETVTQRLYLLQLASEYETLVSSAVHSLYGYATCFQNMDMRLVSLVIATGKNFADTMGARSYTRAFRPDNHTTVDAAADSFWFKAGTAHKESSKTEEPAEQDTLGDRHANSTPGSHDGSDNDDGSDCHEPEEHSKVSVEFYELRDLATLHPSTTEYSNEKILLWIKREFQGYRTLGVGGLNPSLYQALFKAQTNPWIPIAQAYVGETIVNIHRFLHKLLTHVCKDSKAAEAIWHRIIPELVKRYTQAEDHLKFLLQAERDGNLGTLNHYLTQNIVKSKEARTLQRLKNINTYGSSSTTESQPLLRLSDVTTFYQSNEDHEVEDIHDTLKSYCKVARKRFVDNVYMQVVDQILLSSAQSPLKIFNSKWVGSLSDADLADIAGETESVRHKRKVLQEEIESFQKGLAILRG